MEHDSRGRVYIHGRDACNEEAALLLEGPLVGPSSM